LKDRGSDSSHHVGSAAAAALGHLGAAAVPALRDAMKDPDRDTRVLSVQALQVVGREAVPALTNALNDADPMVLNMAVHSLLQIGYNDEAAVRAVQTAAKDKDARRRRQIIKALPSVAMSGGNTEAASRILVEALSDPETDIRRLAIAGINQGVRGYRVASN